MIDDQKSAPGNLEGGEVPVIPAGEVIDSRYRILDLVGRGGMGSVYRAEHVTIRRPVAIKVLHSFMNQLADSARRFEREAFVAGQVNHPNCVGVSDFGKLQDGTLYLVMEFLEGVSLRDVLDRQRCLPVARAVHITRHVLRALSHAHKVGIVHRDMKPDNVILVEREGDRDFAKVLDFGIAMLRDERAGSAKLTQVGMTMGTPSYLSPEQAFGQVVDHRTDLYSVSVMLYEMLAGRPPFISEEPLGVLTMHATVDPPRFAEISPQAGVPVELEEVIRKGLAKSRDQRIASADEYIALVEGFLSHHSSLPVVTGSRPLPSIGLAPTLAVQTPTPFPGIALDGTQRIQAEETAALPARPGLRLSRRLRIALGGFLLLVVLLAILRPSHEQRLKNYLHELQNAEDCEDRRNAVIGLHSLGDSRAIPVLKKARYRMKGGVLGIGGNNENACLREEAERAIEYLERR